MVPFSYLAALFLFHWKDPSLFLLLAMSGVLLRSVGTTVLLLGPEVPKGGLIIFEDNVAVPNLQTIYCYIYICYEGKLQIDLYRAIQI